MYEAHKLAAAGTTGNNTHASVQAGDAYHSAAFQFQVTAVGATPTVSWKIQGSVDGTNFVDLGYITESSDTISAALRVITAVGVQISFLSNPVARKYKHYRLVTSANTNVTYKSDMFLIT